MSSIKEILFRGDQACYAVRGGTFPYVDHALAAGATGLHIWFWGEPFRAVADDFLAYCKDRRIGVHLGIGIGAYGVCDHQDPLDPAVMSRIKDCISGVVDRYDVAGVEFQSGEYDGIEYRGADAVTKSHAQQVCEHLNPYIDFTSSLRPDILLRTELNSSFYSDNLLAETARLIDPRCTVEWSRFIGPYRGPDCYERGRRLLQLRENFSLFLKIKFRRDLHWKEVAADTSIPQMLRFIDHWRGWVKLLDEMGRPTLTICNVDDLYPDKATPLPAAAAALARNPDVSNDELIAQYFQSGIPAYDWSASSGS